EVVRVDVAAFRHKRSLQDAARAARYQALAALVQQHEARALLVAHTLDDQAETVLLNLLRGASLRGLAGMRSDTALHNLPLDVRVARPLLKIDRATTQAYCAFFGQPVVEDPSNQSRAYTRNRVRLDLLPVLERFNPAVRSVLSRTAELAADDV